MSGFVWFVLGVLVGALWRWEYLGVAFGFAVTVVSGIVSFLGAIGTAALLIVTAVTFWLVSRKWAEDARAKFDMKRTWDTRQNYRK